MVTQFRTFGCTNGIISDLRRDMLITWMVRWEQKVLKKSFSALIFSLLVITHPSLLRADMSEPLDNRLTQTIVKQLFPGATRHSKAAGDPPVVAVFIKNEKVGYLFSTHETVRPAGYSGNSFDIIVALGTDGVIRGHELLEEHEPLISDGMIGPKKFELFLNGLNGTHITTSVSRGKTNLISNSRSEEEQKRIDAVSGATISALSMKTAIINSALKVGYITEIITKTLQPLTLDSYSYTEKTWPELVADGSIGVLELTYGELRSKFGSQSPSENIPLGSVKNDNDIFVKLYVGLATIPSIGRNLFGVRAHRRFIENSREGEQQLFIGSEGPYSWIPPNPFLVPLFDLIKIRQGDITLPVLPENFYRARRLAIADYPALHNAGRVRVPPEMRLNPLKKWSVELRISENDSEKSDTTTIDVVLPYRIPRQHVLGSDLALEEADLKTPNYVFFGLFRESMLNDWQLRWVEKQWSIVALLALLSAVTTVILCHDTLCRYRRAYRVIRITLLSVTLVWLGWAAGTQLSILNIMNYLTLLVKDLDWKSVLFEPLMVILSIYVVATLVLWGRGVFCGWLCPFGSLQELLNNLARVIKLPQIQINQSIQERLWSIKYILAIAILGVTFYSAELAGNFAEIEPFKTAITLKFDRAWPYIAYAGILLICGLFVERFFCRFLCPLGGILSLGGRPHVLNWLKRRYECGNPCQICSVSCPVGAINRSGTINMNECLQCLDCQLDYADDQRCPVLISSR